MAQSVSKIDDLYIGREQSLVKHEVLKRYLLRFALIVGHHSSSISYIDGFSGPWNARSDALEDASFCIALEKLREARDDLAKRKIITRLRCFFIESDPTAYLRLKQFADGVKDAEVETKNCEFEAAVPDIVKFVRAGGESTFPFVFIDPKGWKGFAMKTIQPLLQLRPGEVLINFMTRHIKRFVDAPQEQRHEEFEALFGSDEYKAISPGLPVQDREDKLVRLYMKNLKEAGKFTHVCAAVVLHPEMDTTHFHLIYATRHQKGVEVFKGAEKAAMELQEAARAEAQQRRRVARKGQSELFSAPTMHKTSHYDGLRERYMVEAKDRVRELLETRGILAYDTAWTVVHAHPLVWETDLREWLKAWQAEGTLRIDGMKERARVPKFGESLTLVWRTTTAGG